MDSLAPCEATNRQLHPSPRLVIYSLEPLQGTRGLLRPPLGVRLPDRAEAGSRDRRTPAPGAIGAASRNIDLRPPASTPSRFHPRQKPAKSAIH